MKRLLIFLIGVGLMFGSCCSDKCTKEELISDQGCYVEGYVVLKATSSQKWGLVLLKPYDNGNAIPYFFNEKILPTLHKDNVSFVVKQLGNFVYADELEILKDGDTRNICDKKIDAGLAVNMHNMEDHEINSEHRAGHIPPVMARRVGRIDNTSYGDLKFEVVDFVRHVDSQTFKVAYVIPESGDIYLEFRDDTDTFIPDDEELEPTKVHVVKSISPCHFHNFDRDENCHN